MITTVFTGFSSIGLAVVSAWFTSERWAYSRHQGRKWLADILNVFLGHVQLPSFHLPRRVARDDSSAPSLLPPTFGVPLSRTSSGASPTDMRSIFDRSGGSEDSLPMSRFDSEAASRRGSVDEERNIPLDLEAQNLDVAQNSEKAPSDDGSVDQEPNGTQATAGRFFRVVRRVIAIMRPMETGDSRPDTPAHPVLHTATLREKPPSMVSTAGTSSDTGSDGQSEMALEASRLAALSGKVKSMEIAQTLPAHQAFVKHLQFSRDGKFLLATSGWGKTSVIFRVGVRRNSPLTTQRCLPAAGSITRMVCAVEGSKFYRSCGVVRFRLILAPRAAVPNLAFQVTNRQGTHYSSNIQHEGLESGASCVIFQGQLDIGADLSNSEVNARKPSNERNPFGP